MPVQFVPFEEEGMLALMKPAISVRVGTPAGQQTAVDQQAAVEIEEARNAVALRLVAEIKDHLLNALEPEQAQKALSKAIADIIQRLKPKNDVLMEEGLRRQMNMPSTNNGADQGLVDDYTGLMNTNLRRPYKERELPDLVTSSGLAELEIGPADLAPSWTKRGSSSRLDVAIKANDDNHLINVVQLSRIYDLAVVLCEIIDKLEVGMKQNIGSFNQQLEEVRIAAINEKNNSKDASRYVEQRGRANQNAQKVLVKITRQFERLIEILNALSDAMGAKSVNEMYECLISLRGFLNFEGVVLPDSLKGNPGNLQEATIECLQLVLPELLERKAEQPAREEAAAVGTGGAEQKQEDSRPRREPKAKSGPRAEKSTKTRPKKPGGRKGLHRTLWAALVLAATAAGATYTASYGEKMGSSMPANSSGDGASPNRGVPLRLRPNPDCPESEMPALSGSITGSMQKNVEMMPECPSSYADYFRQIGLDEEVKIKTWLAQEMDDFLRKLATPAINMTSEDLNDGKVGIKIDIKENLKQQVFDYDPGLGLPPLGIKFMPESAYYQKAGDRKDLQAGHLEIIENCDSADGWELLIPVEITIPGDPKINYIIFEKITLQSHK